jgi:hypothetical protein
MFAVSQEIDQARLIPWLESSLIATVPLWILWLTALGISTLTIKFVRVKVLIVRSVHPSFIAEALCLYAYVIFAFWFHYYGAEASGSQFNSFGPAGVKLMIDGRFTEAGVRNAISFAWQSTATALLIHLMSNAYLILFCRNVD